MRVVSISSNSEGGKKAVNYWPFEVAVLWQPSQLVSIQLLLLRLSVFVFLQDFKAGLAIAEVELTAANIRDVDRRGFDINTPFKNFWYV